MGHLHELGAHSALSRCIFCTQSFPVQAGLAAPLHAMGTGSAFHVGQGACSLCLPVPEFWLSVLHCNWCMMNAERLLTSHWT